MNIIVFGATGRVGTCFVEQALKAGHKVTAYVRDARRLKTKDVTVIEGDARDPVAVSRALKGGFDASIVCIGGKTLTPGMNVMTDGIRAIISGMKEARIERLVGVSGIAEISRKTKLGQLFIAMLNMTPLRHVIRDHDLALSELQSSGLKWTLAGCPFIKTGPRRGTHHTSLTFPGGFKIIHAPDVADFLLRELADDRFAGNVVGIWY